MVSSATIRRSMVGQGRLGHVLVRQAWYGSAVSNFDLERRLHGRQGEYITNKKHDKETEKRSK